MIRDIHFLFNELPRFTFPFHQREREIPRNGIYIIFKNGERFNSFDRIVRVGTHTGNDQLRSRLRQHFIKENKNRSIFRKNIGRCILNQSKSDYLPFWELDTTSREDRQKNLPLLNLDFEKQLEQEITDHIHKNLSFCVFRVDSKEERLLWESRIVSTLAKSGELMPSPNWLGNHSPKNKIKISGLWQVNELYNEPLREQEFFTLQGMLRYSCNESI